MTMDKAKTVKAIKEILADERLMYYAHLAIEDEAVDRRDRGIQVLNRNGIAIYTRDSQPSSIIRIGTKDAIKIALEAIADRLEKS